MTLRRKSLFVIGATLLGLLSVLYISSTTILMGSFARLEAQQTRDDIVRARLVLDHALDELELLLEGWVVWGGSDHTPDELSAEEIALHLPERYLRQLRLDVVLFLDAAGAPLFARAFDSRGEAPRALPAALRAPLPADHPLLQGEGAVRGFLVVPEGPLLLAARPLRSSQQGARNNGTILVGRYLTAEELQRLGRRAQLSIESWVLTDPGFPAEFQPILDELLASKLVVQPERRDRVQGYTLVEDIHGEPALLLRITRPRTILHQGWITLGYLLFALLVVGLVFGLVMLRFMEQLVLARLARLHGEVAEIGATGDLGQRVTRTGADELSRLAQSINEMLQALERSQERLRESEARYRSLVDLSPDPIAVHDGHHLLFVNGAGVRLMGAGEPRELLGRRVLDFVHPDDQEKVRQRLVRMQRDGTVLPPAEERFVRLDGSAIDVEVTAAPIMYQGGRAAQLIARDITARKQAERVLQAAKEAAERASRTKSSFLTMMSHELRTPLSAIIGYAEILEEDALAAGQSSQLPAIEKIQSSARRLLTLINDLLDISKIEAGKMELHLERFDPLSLVREVVAIIQPLAARNGNRLDWNGPQGLGTMQADMMKVRQSLLNLLSNAAKFTQQGQITLNIRQERADGRAWISFEVRDTGIGMSEEQLDRVFEEFSQGDTSTTRRYGGTGLGLAISRRFSRLMGGDISVQSRPGEGSTFILRLPMEVRLPDGESDSP